MDDLAAVARQFSPRVERHEAGFVILDISGLDRLIGDVPAVAQALRLAAAEQGLAVRVAAAATRVAAALLACGRLGVTVAPPGEERALLADLPISLLALFDESDLASVRGRPARSPHSATSRYRRRGRLAGRTFRVAPHLVDVTDQEKPVLDSAGPVWLAVLCRWGLRTLGELAALPPAALSERLGQAGVWWQRVARGEDPGPLAPDQPARRYEASFDLEWPVEDLEPLSFVLGRLCDTVCADLERDDRAAIELQIALTLVTRAVDRRTLRLPAPMRDARTLRTLAQLDLEARPPAAGIDRVVLTVEAAPARIVQFSLLGRALPFPEQLAPLLARLRALMGEGRVGAAALIDSHRPGAFRLTAFSGGDQGTGIGDQGSGIGGQGSGIGDQGTGNGDRGSEVGGEVRCAEKAGRFEAREAPVMLRRFRVPVPARVVVHEGSPVRLVTDRRGLEGGAIVRCAGPWRTSGEWWQVADARLQVRAVTGTVQVGWDRDEWDVAVRDGSVYRIYQDRRRRRWFIEGIVD